ncbi:MAG: peptidoglycan DD-metalloendopeptidase family protein [Gallionellaceae bacterium]|nr:peptidoglycan DD-metalloendopeptidase family protein [Gallionellaceae bacterium]
MIVLDVKNVGSVTRWLLLIIAAVMLVGCAKRAVRHAPVVERGVEFKKSTAKVAPTSAKKSIAASGKTYTVQKGDTMYGIAFENGVDVSDVAELNNIDNPSAIKIGQQLSIPAVAPTRVSDSKPKVPRVNIAGEMKTQPKAGKIPYSETALAQAEKSQDDKVTTAPAKEEPVVAVAAETDDEESLEWGMPSVGKVIAEFSESANRKGVDIAGKQGQAVVASATGKVVYSGSGLRGYGKLVIIKHNKTYLSAYAHNDQVLVKEGQSVSKGQKIAEMGNTDADQVKLHFEIRKFGKPVDPAQFLPLIKS